MYSPATGWEKKLNKLILENWPEVLPRGRDVVLSFSGGADSVLALYLLLATQHILEPARLILFYLDHGQSIASSSAAERHRILQQHADFAAKFLGQDKFAFVMMRRDVKKISRKLKVSFERAGSLLRRRHLVRAAGGPHALLVTGHSLSDWLETVVLRLNRGSGPDGLHPFATLRAEGGMDFFHPIAHLARAEIRECLRDLRIPWWEDPGNDDMNIARNRVRAALDFHPEGLRRARKNFLASLFMDGRENAVFEEISYRREYRLKLNYFLSQNEAQRQSLLLRGIAFVGLTPVNRGVREALQKKPLLHYGPWHIETENWQGHHSLVFRRGRSKLPRIVPAGVKFLFADELPAAAKIKLSYGHKQVKKIFSELKLSPRQRHVLPVEIDPDDCCRVKKIYLEIFGMKNIVEISQ